MKLLQSEPIFKLLRMLTGLELADLPLADEEEEEEEEEEVCLNMHVVFSCGACVINRFACNNQLCCM